MSAVEAVAVLDRRAAGADHGAHDLRAVGVDGDAEALLPALVAGGLDLLIAQRPEAALPDAARGEHLHHVGAVGLELPDVRANRVGVAGGGGHGAERGQHAGPRHVAAGYRVAQLGVERAPEALDGREAGHQRAVRIADGVQHRPRGVRVPASTLVQPSVGAEVRRQVDVGVDPPGHQRKVGEVVARRAAQPVDPGDRAVAHDDTGVGPGAARAVDQKPGPQRDRCVLREPDSGGGERQRDRGGGQSERSA